MKTSYQRSICSTCEHISYCVITTDKRNVLSCSEFEFEQSSTTSTKKITEKVA
ncbi:hypothetical protein MWU59_12520 [Flavobacteriaceae bacterium F08102]|nr:hypothetical protein [Flavobacteriaceae bacterium F08102]